MFERRGTGVLRSSMKEQKKKRTITENVVAVLLFFFFQPTSHYSIICDFVRRSQLFLFSPISVLSCMCVFVCLAAHSDPAHIYVCLVCCPLKLTEALQGRRVGALRKEGGGHHGRDDECEDPTAVHLQHHHPPHTPKAHIHHTNRDDSTSDAVR